MKFLETMERLFNIKSTRPETNAVLPDPAPGQVVNIADARELAAMSRAVFRDEVELVNAQIPLDSISTDDFDKKTGKRYPDYLERREAREAARRDPEAEALYLIGDVRPR